MTERRNGGGTVEVVVMCCDRAMADTEDEGGAAGGDDGIVIRRKRVPCSSKVEASYLLRLLEAGADGVEVIACPDWKCQFLVGNVRAEYRVDRARRLLDVIGFGGERVGISRAENLSEGGLRRLVRARAEEARSLGANPMKEEAER